MIYILLGSAALYPFSNTIAALTAICAVLNQKFPEKKFQWVGVVTFISYLLAHRIVPEKFLPHESPRLETLLICTTLLLASILLWKFTKKTLERNKYRYWWAPFVVLFSLPLFNFFTKNIFYIFFTISLSKFIFFLYLKTPKGQLPMPFFAETINPMQFDFSNNKILSAKSNASEILSSGAKMLILALGFFCLYSLSISILFSIPFIDLIKNWTFNRPFYSEIDMQLAFSQGWSGKKMRILLLGQFFDNITKYIIGTMLIIGSIRLCGIPIFRGIYRPFSAKSFNDFMYRFYFFYSRLFFDFIYFPIFYRTSWIRWPRIRVIFSLFAAIFGGGLFFHFIRNFGQIFKLGYIEAIFWQWQFYPYFFLIAFSCCISSLFQLLNIKIHMPKTFRFFLYFSILFLGQLINAVRVMELPAGAEWDFLWRALH